MGIDDFRAETRRLLERALEDAQQTDEREALIERYTDELTLLYGRHAHALLTEVIEDARTRLDARLSPDPIRQTIATVQTTVQDLWNALWGPGDIRQ
ncbi:MAG: hypothetical protein C0183_16040 [Roseiflexus castenholzii]|uniref:hypothetical protein n=1 Tax=Roseiflexus castenholzii TaxID=120962 RepID=UPI000CB4E866|nr:MAG: hypothetical protein C0183_16040 [Roseiflexus castenholzii]